MESRKNWSGSYDVIEKHSGGTSCFFESSNFSFALLHLSWVSLKTFWERLYKETKGKRKISEKREFVQERFFPEKILFSKRKFSFHIFFSNYFLRRVIKHENRSIGCVRTIKVVQKSRKIIRSGQKVKKRIFSGKKSLLKKLSFFLRFFSFSRDFSLFL